ncbi:hypothetical protein [Streptomyces decoyicus]|uniref:hypothetical protein n=1 Tax=Streptomyces decoyicus TaxID=249567 RepID=UPI003F4CA1D9
MTHPLHRPPRRRVSLRPHHPPPRYARITVLIPEPKPAHLWQRLLQNQRGAVVAHAVRRDTDAVTCRLPFRLAADARMW